MNKVKIVKAIKGIANTAKAYAPEIMVVTGLTSLVTATVLAVKATPKAEKAIKAKEEEIEEALEDEGAEVICPICGEKIERSIKDVDAHLKEYHPDCTDISIKDFLSVKLTWQEKVKTCWKFYIPTAFSTLGGIGLIIFSNRLGAKRGAEIASAYRLSQLALQEYEAKAVELYGEKKDQEIKAKVVKDQVDKKWKGDGFDIIDTGKGKTLCFDVLTGRFFYSDINEIERAVNKVNSMMLLDGLSGYASLNDFYQQIGLADAGIGSVLGWSVEDGNIELSPSSGLTPDNIPYYAIDFTYRSRPHYGYDSATRWDGGEYFNRR